MRFEAGGSFRLGTIRGIAVRAHWSWVAIFVLLSWTLAEGRFFAETAEWNTVERWALAVGTSIVFFASVVAHELAHAFMAQRFGMPVPFITLFAFGGVASVAGEMRTPGEEFKVAIVGPLTSWAIGVLFGALWLVLPDGGIRLMCAYIGGTNVLLGLFNLLPGFPLDGGRVFRAALWARNRNLIRATRYAAVGGEVVAYGLMLAGAVSVFAVQSVAGLWYVIIGMFLRSTARRSYAELMQDLVLRDVPARLLMLPPGEPVEAAMSVQQLVDERGGSERFFLVRRNEVLVGLLTISDIVRTKRAEWDRTTLGAIMVPVERVITIEPETSLSVALRLMHERGVFQLPVIEDGRMIGVVLRGDLLRQVDIAMRGGDDLRRLREQPPVPPRTPRGEDAPER